MRAGFAGHKSYALSFVIASLLWLAARDALATTRFDVVSTTTSLGSPLHALVVGETVTIDIRTSQSTNVYGLAASIWNYDEAVLDFVSGQAVARINHAHCFPNYPSPYDPCYPPYLSNNRQGELAESRLPGQGNRVSIFDAVGLSATYTHPLDPGLDGVVGGGDAQFRVTFIATGLGSTTFLIGTGYLGDGEVQPGAVLDNTARTPVPITVVPEPGTGILVGLGLVALAASRRPRSRALADA